MGGRRLDVEGDVTLGKIAREFRLVEPSALESDVPVGTQQVERRPPDPRARQFVCVGAVVRYRNHAHQIGARERRQARRRLSEHQQIEAAVVELLEQVLDRAVRAHSQPKPGEAVPRRRRALVRFT